MSDSFATTSGREAGLGFTPRGGILPPISLPTSFMADSKNSNISEPSVVCPYCRESGNVTFSEVIIIGERHFRWHCGCCRHVWMERERRPEDFPYRPMMTK